MFTIISYFQESLGHRIGCTTSAKNYSELLTTTPKKAVAPRKKPGGRRVTTCLQAARHQIGCGAGVAMTWLSAGIGYVPLVGSFGQLDISQSNSDPLIK